MISKEELLYQYSLLQIDYTKFKNYMQNQVENMLIENNIKYQSLNGRIKRIDSLSQKLDKKEIIERLDNDIKNINDLCGIRIVLYDNNNLSKVIQIIQSKYEIVDFKGKRYKYNANNITIKINDGFFKNFKCEIQLVTVMSHNLIEIGHDIIYKNNETLIIKDKEEFDNISKEYDKCLEDVYRLEARINNIKNRANNIIENYEKYSYIISDEYLNEIKNNDSLEKFYLFCEDLTSISQYLVRNNDKVKDLYEKNIFIELTKNITKLEEENSYLYGIELVFDKFMELLTLYSRLWEYQYNEIIDILVRYLIEKENCYRLKDSFFKMIENSITYGIKDNYWGFFEKLKDWVAMEKEFPNYRIKVADKILNSNIKYVKHERADMVKLFDKKINYTDEGIKAIKELYEVCCNIFLENQNIDIYNTLIAIMYKFDFLVDSTINFFYENYDEIHDLYKYDIYNVIYKSYDEVKIDRKYRDKIKEDNFFKIWKNLNYHYYELLDEEKLSKEYIKRYIININTKDISEIERTIECYNELIKNKESVNQNIYEFLYNIGMEYSQAVILFSKYKNEYIYLGLLEKGIKLNKLPDICVLKALSNIFVKKIFDKIINTKSKNPMVNEIICLIIVKNNLFANQNYKNELIDKIAYFNRLKIPILSKIFVSCDLVKSINRKECDVILDNYKYVLKNEDYNNLISLHIKNIYLKFPGRIRKFFYNLVKEEYRLGYNPSIMNLYSCKNNDRENKNNIIFAIKLLREFKYIECSRYIEILLKKRDKDYVSIIMDIIQVDKSFKTLNAISILINIVEFKIEDGWYIVKYILKNSDDKKIINNLYDYMEGPGFVKVRSLNENNSEKIKIISKLRKSEKDEMLKEFLDSVKKRLRDSDTDSEYMVKMHKIEQDVKFEGESKL